MAQHNSINKEKGRLHAPAKQEDLFNTSSELLRRYLKENNLRCTPERLAILKQVCAYKGWFTAEHLLQDLPASMPISVATAYNTLTLLCNCNILRRQPQAKQVKTIEYTMVLTHKSTMYFTCVRCGRQVEFRDKAVENILQERPFNNFNMSNFSLSVYGVCKTCRKKYR